MACENRGAIPPNGLTAILRSIPVDAAPLPIHLRSGEANTASANPERRPKFAGAIGNGSDGWWNEEVMAWVEATPAGSPAFTVLIGDFSPRQVESAMKSQNRAGYRIELTQIFPGPDVAVGLAPGRLIYGPLQVVERIASFRGGAGSLLDVNGLRDVSTATGSAGMTAIFQPLTGCPAPIWIAAAVRYDNEGLDAAMLWYYPEAEPAARAGKQLQSQLPSRLPPGVEIRLADPRNRQAVVALRSSEAGAAHLIEMTRPNGAFDGLPECPK